MSLIFVWNHIFELLLEMVADLGVFRGSIQSVQYEQFTAVFKSSFIFLNRSKNVHFWRMQGVSK